MHKLLTHAALAAAALSLAAGGHAAEATKFRLTTSIYVDGKGAGMKQPEGVACGGSVIVVADSGNGRLLRYSVAGQTVTAVDDLTLPQVPYPIRAQLDSKGTIYALDGRVRRIARIAASGEFKGYLDFGGVNGAIVPRSIRIDRNDLLYILDIFSGRVLVTDPAGKVQREIPFPKEQVFFSDLAVDAGGTIFLVDSVGRRVYSIPKNSDVISPLLDSLKEQAKFPTAIALDGRGNIYVVDQNGSGIVILGLDGSFRGRQLRMGWKDGFLRYPSQLCIDDRGNVFIADRGNNRVDVFTIVQ
jgi:sugar lactone lactonase YvrE